MKMQKVSALVIVMLTFIAGCNIIDDPVINYGSYRQDLYGPAPVFSPLSEPHRKVLLEDFTGHDCGNCPNGHAVATTLLDQYGEDLAVVAIHAGSLAAPFPPDYPADWTTEEGEYYLLTQVGSDVMPKGRINRNPGASTIFSPSGWTNKVTEAFATDPEVNLQLDVTYVPDNQHLNVHVNSEWLQDLSGEYRLVILITESGIVAPQLWYGNDPEYVEEYDHEHMLRASVSGSTGLAVASNPQSGQINTTSYTYNWNSTWVPENCEVVAFITEGENGRILNVEKAYVIE